MALATSRSCSALDKLPTMQYQDDSPAIYKPYHLPHRLPSLSNCWRKFVCCRSGTFLQRVVLTAALLTTIATWRGVLNHERLEHAVAESKNILQGCGRRKVSVHVGHTNPCWNLGAHQGCTDGCETQIVCAPKVIFAGMDQCYDMRIVSNMLSKSDVVMVNDDIEFDGTCPMEYLTKYKKVVKERGIEHEPTFYLNSERLLPSLIPSSDSRYSTASKLKWLSHWLRPNSRIVIFICDPVLRLLRHIGEELVLVEPTKKAVHAHVMARIYSVQSCIEERGIKKCQNSDTGRDVFYSYLLEGIYLPYIVRLLNHIPPKLVKLVYVNELNSTAFSSAMADLTNELSVVTDDAQRLSAERSRLQAAEELQKLISSIRKDTFRGIKQFFEPFNADVKHLLDIFSAQADV